MESGQCGHIKSGQCGNVESGPFDNMKVVSETVRKVIHADTDSSIGFTHRTQNILQENGRK